MHEVRCLYCSLITGHSVGLAHLTVCGSCQWGLRDEAKEIGAGLRTWRRPLMYPVLSAFLGCVPVTYPCIEVLR